MRIRGTPLAILVSIPIPFLLAQTPTASRALVEGVVVNATTAAPLAGARVKLERAQDEDPIYGKVDPQGHFAFRNLNPGFYTLVIDAPGFHQSRTSVDVRIPRPNNTGGVLRGVITSNSSSQIPPASVNKTTDDDGAIHATVNAPMLAQAVIFGKVTDPYGTPLAGASVEIFKPRPPNRVGAPSPTSPDSATTLQTMISADGRGEYRAGRLEPGTYWVVANKPNGMARFVWQSSFRVTYYPAALDVASAQPLKIEAGQQVRADIQILRQSGVSVSGHLLGLPVPEGPSRSLYTRIALQPAKSDVINPDTPFTNAENDFEFTDVLPGRYTLFAQTEDMLSDPMNANRKPLFGLVTDVEIGPRDMAGFDLTLVPMKSLSGTVEFTGSCSDPPAFVQLQGRTPLYGGQLQAAIGTDRTFTMQNIPAGRYTVVMTGMKQPYAQLPPAAAVKGTRDVLKSGLEAPWKDDDILKITVACSSQGVQR